MSHRHDIRERHLLVLKELERTASSLKRLEQNPGVDHNMLSALLGEISQKMDAMHRIDGQIASSLKTSEFIASIRQRSAIPGGTCDFDLPAYHYWLQQPMEQRSRDLAEWLGHFDAIGQSIQLVMKLTRDSTPLKPVTAPGGLYQRTLDTSQPYQLIRIALPEGSPWFAETSGGRHRFTVNTQPLDLTTVLRDECLHLHLTGTDFYEPIVSDVVRILPRPTISSSFTEKQSKPASAGSSTF